MTEVLFGEEVSSDSDWGNDEPSVSSNGEGGKGITNDCAVIDAATSTVAVGCSVDTVLNNVEDSAKQGANIPSKNHDADTKNESDNVISERLQAKSLNKLKPVDVASSAAYARASPNLPVASPSPQEGQRGCFYLIGLGLGDEKDITVNGLEIVKRCQSVFLEHYTAVLGVHGTKALESFYGRPVEIADRTMVEQDSDTIFEAAINGGEVAMVRMYYMHTFVLGWNGRF